MSLFSFFRRFGNRKAKPAAKEAELSHWERVDQFAKAYGQNVEIAKTGLPKYDIAIRWVGGIGYVPFFCLVDEPDRWSVLPYTRGSTSGLFYDPIEDSEDFKLIEQEVDKRVKEATKDLEDVFGACHGIWSMKKDILKEEYGINWHSVADVNPDCDFD